MPQTPRKQRGVREGKMVHSERKRDVPSENESLPPMLNSDSEMCSNECRLGKLCLP